MSVSLSDAIRNARHRLDQHQPGRPLQICKEDLLALVRFAEKPPKAASTEAENVLREWGLAILAADGMAPTCAALLAEPKKHLAAKRVALRLAGGTEGDES